jgi:hypothetical protein
MKNINIQIETGKEQSNNFEMHGDWLLSYIVDTLNNYLPFALSHKYQIDIPTIDPKLEKRLSIATNAIMSNTVNAELRRKRTLAYFNGKTFADIKTKQMQEIVYEIIG